MIETEEPISFGGIDSLQCKVLQYEYSVYKLKRFMSSLDKLSSLTSNQKIPMTQYMIPLIDSIFAISDSAFQNKLSSLSNFKVPQISVVSITKSTVPIAYDRPDNKVLPLDCFPESQISLKCLKTLLVLCRICIKGYTDKLDNAKGQLGTQKFLDISNMAKQILETRIFRPESYDVKLSEDLVFSISDISLLDDPSFVEASFIDMDIAMIFKLSDNFRKTLLSIKSELLSFQKLKNLMDAPKEKISNAFPDWQYSLHIIFLLTIRLNEVYSIIRRTGRIAYLSNLEHLQDKKLVFQSRNPALFSKILKEIESYLTFAKKNGPLIANLTRFFRNNAAYPLNVKLVLEFSNFVGQTLLVTSSMLEKLSEFGVHWAAAEMRFRKVYSLPLKNLSAIIQSIDKGSPVTQKTPSTGLQNPKKPNLELKNIRKIGDLSSSSSFSTEESKLTNMKLNERQGSPSSRSTRSSRSSSVSSLPGEISNRGGIIASPINNRFYNKVAHVRNSSPDSVKSLTANHSEATDTVRTGRNRSNSQPVYSAVAIASKNATSGAAAALSRSNSVKSSISPRSNNRKITGENPKAKMNNTRLSSNSSNRKQPINHRNSLDITHLTVKSPSPGMQEKNLGSLPENPNDDKVQAKALSANQRFQKHLLEASKSGELFTQQKESLTSVVFDPNHPNALKLRRASENTGRDAVLLQESKSESEIPIRSSSSPEGKKSLGNSATKILEKDASPNVKNASVTEGLKKVRFTGVPAYNEAEDAPSSYSSKILRNFAAFKSPIISKPGLRGRDQQLKREESMTLKRQLHHEV